MNYGRLKASFVERFDLGNDKQQLLIDYHDLRAKNSPSLGDYANQVQSIGLKLNKSTAENLLQFKLGLPVPMFRWIDERRPRTIENALRLAMDFDAMFGRGTNHCLPPPVNMTNHSANDVGRVEVPMEHIQRSTPAAERFGGRGNYQRNRVFSARNPGASNNSLYRPTNHGVNRATSGTGGTRGGHAAGAGFGRGASRGLAEARVPSVDRLTCATTNWRMKPAQDERINWRECSSPPIGSGILRETRSSPLPKTFKVK